MRRSIAALLLLILASCAGNTQQNATEALTAACVTYANGLKILATKRADGSLDDKAAAIVGKVVLVVSPICTASTPPTDIAGALAVVNNEMPALAALLQ